MRLKAAALFLIVSVFLVFFGITGCNSSSDDDPATVSQLSTYGEDVQACTPYLGVGGDLSDWDLGWNPQLPDNYTVLYKLFGPGEITGVEGIYDPVESLDEYIEMINAVSENWDTDLDGATVSIGEYDLTVTVNNDVTSVTVPFWGNEVSVDRIVTIEGEEEEGTFTINVAFTVGETEEALVAHCELGNGEQGVYYAQRNSTTGDMEIWSACYSPDAEDPFYCAFKWQGNPDEGTFAITQYTSATGGWTVMGGGSIDGDMAFISGNNDIVGRYYLTLTMDDINNGTDPETIVAEATEAPDGTGVLAYITVDNDACLGYLTDYPDTAESISWSMAIDR